jgi:hypothetical protein
MDCSFDAGDSMDLNSFAGDYLNDADDTATIAPNKKLCDAFENCVKPNGDHMKVFLRVRPINMKTESTMIIDSETSITTNAPESSKRAQYTKTEARSYVSFFHNFNTSTKFYLY